MKAYGDEFELSDESEVGSEESGSKKDKTPKNKIEGITDQRYT